MLEGYYQLLLYNCNVSISYYRLLVVAISSMLYYISLRSEVCRGVLRGGEGTADWDANPAPGENIIRGNLVMETGCTGDWDAAASNRSTYLELLDRKLSVEFQ